MTEFPTLAALEQLLAETHEQTEQRTVADAITETLALCQAARTVEAAARLQLQGALIAIREGRPDGAVALIERAIGIGERWVCQQGKFVSG